jgi:hypothetical protein
MEIFLLHENTTLSVAIYKRQYLTDRVSRPGQPSAALQLIRGGYRASG